MISQKTNQLGELATQRVRYKVDQYVCGVRFNIMMQVKSLCDDNREDLVPKGVCELKGLALIHRLPGLVGVPLGHLCQGHHDKIQVVGVIMEGAGFFGVDQGLVCASEAYYVVLAGLINGVFQGDQAACHSAPRLSISDESFHMSEELTDRHLAQALICNLKQTLTESWVRHVHGAGQHEHQLWDPLTGSLPRTWWP